MNACVEFSGLRNKKGYGRVWWLLRELASEFGVHTGTVGHITKGDTWSG